MYTFTQSQISQVFEFANQIYQKDTMRVDFCNRDVGNRTYSDFMADMIQGKLAEIMFSEFAFSMAGVRIGVDFDIYHGHEKSDGSQDINWMEYKGKVYRSSSKVDVKATRGRSQWLLVEDNRFHADAYVMARIDLPYAIESNYTLIKKSGIKGEIVGFAYYFDIVDPATKDPWFLFINGDRLFSQDILDSMPDISNGKPSDLRKWLRNCDDIRYVGPQMKAKRSFGFPARWLRRDDKQWERFFSWIISSRVFFNDMQAGKFMARGVHA